MRNLINKTSSGGIIIFIIILLIALRQFGSQYEIKKYQKVTKGKITNIDHISLTRYALYYEYYVINKKYIGEVEVSFFKCKNGRKGCIGNEFDVYYSSKTPKYSRIDLKEYEKYKKTIELFK